MNRRVTELLPPAAIVLFAAILLLWNLDAKYLWQDEANTAVLAGRWVKYGRPLAYDGVNFLGPDTFTLDDVKSIDARTRGAQAALDFYTNRHFLRPDHTWQWHPWGQFILAGASIRLLGQTTLAARLPFAIASILAVWFVYRLGLFAGGRLTAQAASVLLALNVYWILHGRQCRYYGVSSLFFVLTLLAYARWQTLRRWGRTTFILAAWCWFQVDYGTVWPVFAVLFADTIAVHWRKLWKPLAVWIGLGISILPFFWYYVLWNRVGGQLGKWPDRLRLNLFNINEYMIAAPVFGAAILLLILRWKRMPGLERRLVAILCGTIAAICLWVPAVTVSSFLRYAIIVAPAGCLLTAWLFATATRAGNQWICWTGVALVALTPWLSMPFHAIIGPPAWVSRSTAFRPELTRLGAELRGGESDPNREVIEWLRKNAAPQDEILINYEDLPLMYYLPNPIRGGIAAFRAEDDSRSPPEFLILRPGIPFVYWDVFQREALRYRWRLEPLGIMPVMWGNNPDPMAGIPITGGQPIVVARRIH